MVIIWNCTSNFFLLSPLAIIKINQKFYVFIIFLVYHAFLFLELIYLVATILLSSDSFRVL